MHLHELRMNLSESQTLQSKIELVQKLANILEYDGEVPSEAYRDEWELAFQVLAASHPVEYPSKYDLIDHINTIETKLQRLKDLTNTLIDNDINAGVIGRTIRDVYDLQNNLSAYETQYERVNFIMNLFDEILGTALGNIHDDKFKQKMAQTALKKLGLDHLLN